MADGNLQDIRGWWGRKQASLFPATYRGAAVRGIDIDGADADIDTCLSVFLQAYQLDAEHYDLLERRFHELQLVTSFVDKQARPYFVVLYHLAHAVLAYLDSSQGGSGARVAERSSIFSCLPRHKSDIKRAEALLRLPDDRLLPAIPFLCLWLQDINWPVAHIMLPLFNRLGAALLPEVQAILETDDASWKYWMLEVVVKGLPGDAIATLRDELERLSRRPTPAEAAEELHTLAREILG